MNRLGFYSFHPFTQLVFFAAVFVLSFLSMNPVIVCGSLLFSVLYTLVYNGRSELVRLLRLGLPLCILVTMVNPMYNHRGRVVLLTLFSKPITLEALLYGLVSGLMLLCVILWFGVFTALLSGERLRALFGGRLSSTVLVFTMTLRLIPSLIRRQQEISDTLSLLTPPLTNTQGVLSRAKTFAQTITVLIASALEDSIDTARSMQARGYSAARRTQYQTERFAARDITVCVTAILLFVLSLAIYTTFGLSFVFYPVMSTVTIAGWQGVYALLIFVLLMIPIVCDAWEVVRWNWFR